MTNELTKLHNILSKMGYHKQASIIIKLSKEYKQYIVQSGDNLGQIALNHGTTVSEIQRVNGMTGTAIRAGEPLNIPEPTNANEVVAATLIGEGGSLDKSLMKKIMTIIINRAKILGKSNYDIVTDSEQFSYWNGRSITRVLNGPLGREHPYWEEAVNIAENSLTDPNLGASTHYYGHAHRIPENHRNYEDHPHWAAGNCWTEIYRDTHHVYGTDISGDWGDCQP